MQNQNPVLFYFWDHSNRHELRTNALNLLVARADVVFCEHIMTDPKQTDDDEDAYNGYIQTGKRERWLPSLSQLDKEKYLAKLMTGTNKRLVLERAEQLPFDYNTKHHDAIEAFFDCHLEDAIGIYNNFMEKIAPHLARRTEKTGQQILDIPETTAVIIGSGHIDLEKRISAYRKTETHFPYKDYPNSYEVLLTEYFREKGEINRELYLKSMIEVAICNVLAACREITNKQERILSYEYATLFTKEQIMRYRDFLSDSRWVVSETALTETFRQRKN